MTDLSRIEKPFGLLREETRVALKAHKGPIEIYSSNGWREITAPAWDSPTNTYRAKPVPREFWLCGALIFSSKAAAEDLSGKIGQVLIHVREVM